MNELQTSYLTAQTIYVLIRDESANIWNGSSFVAYNAPDYASYAVYLTEQGGSDGYYIGDFPTDIESGTYGLEFFAASGSVPDVIDATFAGGDLIWDGSGVASLVLCSLDFAKQANNITVDTDDTIISAFLYSVTKAIQNYCRRDFFLTSYTEAYDGPNDYQLVLNQTPITSLSSVTLGVNDFAPEVISGANYIIQAKTGIIQMKPTAIGTPYFYGGFQNISVAYVAGYTTIPQDLQEACAIYVGALYKSRLLDRTVQSEKIGDYAISYRQAFKLMSEDVKELLAPYRRFIV